MREEGIEPTSSAWKADDVTVYPHPLFFTSFLILIEEAFLPVRTTKSFWIYGPLWAKAERVCAYKEL